MSLFNFLCYIGTESFMKMHFKNICLHTFISQTFIVKYCETFLKILTYMKQDLMTHWAKRLQERFYLNVYGFKTVLLN